MLSAATFRAVNEDLYSEKFPSPVVPLEIPKSKDTVSMLFVSRPRRKKKKTRARTNCVLFPKVDARIFCCLNSEATLIFSFTSDF